VDVWTHALSIHPPSPPSPPSPHMRRCFPEIRRYDLLNTHRQYQYGVLCAFNGVELVGMRSICKLRPLQRRRHPGYPRGVQRASRTPVDGGSTSQSSSNVRVAVDVVRTMGKFGLMPMRLWTWQDILRWGPQKYSRSTGEVNMV
jgi:hypothetical protein